MDERNETAGELRRYTRCNTNDHIKGHEDELPCLDRLDKETI
jgi:hypothetical protein